MGKPDMAADVDLVKASIKQAVGKLTGDQAVEAQGAKASSKAKSKKAGTIRTKAEKVHKE